MDKAVSVSGEPWQGSLRATEQRTWLPIPATVLDHARMLGLTLTDIGVMTSIRTLQEVDGYTRLRLSQIAARCPLDLPATVARSIAHMQQVGLLAVTMYGDGQCSYDFSPLFQRSAAFISKREGDQDQHLLAAYQEAGQPFGPTLAGFCTWCVQKQQRERIQACPDSPSPLSRSGAASLTPRRVPSAVGDHTPRPGTPPGSERSDLPRAG
jgi:hypothetical protein